MKDELRGGGDMAEVFGLREKTFSYFIGDGSEDNKAKSTKKCVIKRKLKSENCKTCLEATELESEINHLGKN